MCSKQCDVKTTSAFTGKSWIKLITHRPTSVISFEVVDHHGPKAKGTASSAEVDDEAPPSMIDGCPSIRACLPYFRMPRDRLTTLCRWRKLGDSSVASWRPAGLRVLPHLRIIRRALEERSVGRVDAPSTPPPPDEQGVGAGTGLHARGLDLSDFNLPRNYGNDEAERMLPKVRPRA